jgi:hypothetical protein
MVGPWCRSEQVVIFCLGRRLIDGVTAGAAKRAFAIFLANIRCNAALDAD